MTLERIALGSIKSNGVKEALRKPDMFDYATFAWHTLESLVTGSVLSLMMGGAGYFFYGVLYALMPAAFN